jgi:hypothetical protein
MAAPSYPLRVSALYTPQRLKQCEAVIMEQDSPATATHPQAPSRRLRKVGIAVGGYALLWALTAYFGGNMVQDQLRADYGALLSRPNVLAKLDTLCPMPFLVGSNFRIRWGSLAPDGTYSGEGFKRRDYYVWLVVKPVAIQEDVMVRRDGLNWMWRLTGKATLADDLLGF